MANVTLGSLKSVDLRDVWEDEARAFTPWLAEEGNLALLGESVGLELEFERLEVEVGPFSADILCKNTADNTWVLIENQMERTDHRHLGQILTYAAGLSAKTIIWIAKSFTDEHRAALDWLNENTAEDLAFFGLEIELWRIGSSDPAAKFNVVSKPNDWTREVKSSSTSGAELSETKKLQYQFWTAFKEWAEEHTDLRLQRPGYQHWLTSTVGRAGIHIYAITSTWNSVEQINGPELRVELNLNSPHAKDQFEKLQAMKDELTTRFDLPLHWHNLPNTKSAKLFVRCDMDFTNNASWPNQFSWLGKYMALFRDVFSPIVKTL